MQIGIARILKVELEIASPFGTPFCICEGGAVMDPLVICCALQRGVDVGR